VTDTADYAGVVTRAIAFVIDCAIVNLVAVSFGAGVALVLTVLPGKQTVQGWQAALAGVVFAIWAGAYWATFWSTTGQTPGGRVMQVRVVRSDGGRLHTLMAVVRVGATVLAALPLFAGFVPILFTQRRRGLNDWIAHTVVVRVRDHATSAYDERAGVAQPRLAGSRGPVVEPQVAGAPSPRPQ
jgi:uncharacterized RDD family membrane protein YckC